MTHLLASEGGYQTFELGGTEWFWLIFSAGTAVLAILVVFFLMRGVLAAEQGTSLSSMFTRFLQAFLRERKSNGRRSLGPITRKATGLGKLPAGKDYREVLTEALMEKYGL